MRVVWVASTVALCNWFPPMKQHVYQFADLSFLSNSANCLAAPFLTVNVALRSSHVIFTMIPRNFQRFNSSGCKSFNLHLSIILKFGKPLSTFSGPASNLGSLQKPAHESRFTQKLALPAVWQFSAQELQRFGSAFQNAFVLHISQFPG